MHHDKHTDEELMGRVAVGDITAFETLYDRYGGQAYSLARHITGRAGGAEEATQDAFLALWRGAHRFDPERGCLATWLFALVRYRSIDSLRRGAARPPHQDLADGAAEAVEAPERTDEQVIAIEESAQARRLLADLPANQREVIGLAYFAGFTQTEIAARVGIPLGTVKARVRLGLTKLRAAADFDSLPPRAA